MVVLSKYCSRDSFPLSIGARGTQAVCLAAVASTIVGIVYPRWKKKLKKQDEVGGNSSPNGDTGESVRGHAASKRGPAVNRDFFEQLRTLLKASMDFWTGLHVCLCLDHGAGAVVPRGGAAGRAHGGAGGPHLPIHLRGAAGGQDGQAHRQEGRHHLRQAPPRLVRGGRARNLHQLSDKVPQVTIFMSAVKLCQSPPPPSRATG